MIQAMIQTMILAMKQAMMQAMIHGHLLYAFGKALPWFDFLLDLEKMHRRNSRLEENIRISMTQELVLLS